MKNYRFLLRRLNRGLGNGYIGVCAGGPDRGSKSATHIFSILDSVYQKFGKNREEPADPPLRIAGALSEIRIRDRTRRF